jgi:hypothetical protein
VKLQDPLPWPAAAIRRHHYVKTKEFWIAIATGRLVLHRPAVSFGRELLVTYFVDAVCLGLATAPAVIKFVQDLENAKGPDRDNILHKDLVAVTRAATAEALRQILRHAGRLRNQAALLRRARRRAEENECAADHRNQGSLK